MRLAARCPGCGWRRPASCCWPGAVRRDRAFRHRDARASTCRRAGKTAGSCPAISSRAQTVSQSIAPQPWMAEPATRRLLAALAQAGIEARFVGGCVRDALLGRRDRRYRPRHPGPPRRGHRGARQGRHQGGADRDRARHRHRGGQLPGRRGISRSPRCGAMSRPTAGTRASRSTPTGARTPRAAISRSTRSTSTPDGTLHDPVGGLADLAAHRVRFVGDPATRIAEDVLRVLRYYRFEARFGGGEATPPRAPPAARRRRCYRSSVGGAGRRRADPAAGAARPAGGTAHDGGGRRARRDPPRSDPPRPAGSTDRALNRRRQIRCAVWPRWSRSMPAARRRWPSGCACRMPNATGSSASRRPGRSIPPAMTGRSAWRSTGSAPSAIATSRCWPRPTGPSTRPSLPPRSPWPSAGRRRDFRSPGAMFSRSASRPGLGSASCSPPFRQWWEDGDFAADRAACQKRLRELAERPDAAV